LLVVLAMGLCRLSWRQRLLVVPAVAVVPASAGGKQLLVVPPVAPYLLVVPAAAAAGSTCGNHLPLVPAEKHLSPLADAVGADGTSGHRLLVVPTTVPQVVRAILPCLLPPSLPPLPTQCQHGANTVPTRCQHGSCKTHIWSTPAGYGHLLGVGTLVKHGANTEPTRSQHGIGVQNLELVASAGGRRRLLVVPAVVEVGGAGSICWWDRR